MQKPSAMAWMLLLTLAVIWGSSFILIKKGLMGLASAEVGSLRIVAASFFLLPLAIKRFKHIRGKGKILYFLFVGFLGSLIPSFLFATAQTQLASAITGILNALVPIFTLLIAVFIFGQKQTTKVFSGILVGFVGTAILVTSSNEGVFDKINSYALLVVLATICYASNLNLIKSYLDDIHPVTVTSISMLLVGPIAAVHLFGFTSFWDRFMEGGDSIYLSTFYVCLLGIMSTAIALIIFNKMLQMTNPLFASSVTYIIPIVAVVWGMIDGEELYLMHYIGMFAVGLGVYITNSSGRVHKKNGRIK